MFRLSRPRGWVVDPWTTPTTEETVDFLGQTHSGRDPERSEHCFAGGVEGSARSETARSRSRLGSVCDCISKNGAATVRERFVSAENRCASIPPRARCGFKPCSLWPGWRPNLAQLTKSTASRCGRGRGAGAESPGRQPGGAYFWPLGPAFFREAAAATGARRYNSALDTAMKF